ncbi:MAG TPA: MarR family transcriptional regulator [Candidatus Borkfalkia excrementavium]|uniref:MarR family transcriptional regulator n=1 Tax=Candidatus Borkfalkia excrementavium TaxID=2838505 RepID=A0A9D2CFP3_9FIRM|nr:MarR family transcriptional regulator [Candidatus Borkfalkia excrementavium]
MTDFLTENYIHRYNTLWRETSVLYEDWAKKRGISYFELLTILSVTEAQTPCTQKDICDQWILPKQTVNSVLANLVKRGWVRLSPSPKDRRNKEILLTGEGKIAAAKIAGDLQEKENAVWLKLGKKRADEMLENTAIYNQFFKEENGL